MEESGRSVGWVMGALMLAIAALGWGFLAGSYSGAHAPKYSAESDADFDNRTPSTAMREGKGRFISNAIEQLPNAPAIISWHFSNRIWLPIVILVLEGLALVGGIGMMGLEKRLSRPPRRRR